MIRLFAELSGHYLDSYDRAFTAVVVRPENGIPAYNAENQLVRMSSVLPAGFTGRRLRLDFRYDYQGRRVEKRVYDNDTASETLARRYLYDGWNLIAETDLSGSLQRVYTWGLDLAGSLTATGGVGALLQIDDLAAGQTLAAAYDGNGNVAALVNLATGATAVAYEYDPCGNLLRAEGAYAQANPFRFSTKFQDQESGLVYYGQRYYSSSMGRFINRDPIEEAGGLNLYGFVGNNGVNRWDYLGMDPPMYTYVYGTINADGSPDFNVYWVDQNGNRGIDYGNTMYTRQAWPSGPSYGIRDGFDAGGIISSIATNRLIADVQNDNASQGGASPASGRNSGGTPNERGSSVTAHPLQDPVTGDQVGNTSTTWYSDGTSTTITYGPLGLGSAPNSTAGVHAGYSDGIPTDGGLAAMGGTNLISPVDQARFRVGMAALMQVGSTAWDGSVARGNFPEGSNKCNLFVSEMTELAGASAGFPNAGGTLNRLFGAPFPPVAGQWADPGFAIPGWRVLGSGEAPQFGDVAAQRIRYVDATGHVAIVTGSNRTTGTSEIVHQIATTDWGFRNNQQGQVVFRRWEGPGGN